LRGRVNGASHGSGVTRHSAVVEDLASRDGDSSESGEVEVSCQPQPSSSGRALSGKSPVSMVPILTHSMRLREMHGRIGPTDACDALQGDTGCVLPSPDSIRCRSVLRCLIDPAAARIDQTSWRLRSRMPPLMLAWRGVWLTQSEGSMACHYGHVDRVLEPAGIRDRRRSWRSTSA